MTPDNTLSEGSTDLLLLEKILFDLFSVANKEDKEEGLSRAITDDERGLIEYAVKTLGPADSEFIDSIELNYKNFRILKKEIEAGHIKTFDNLRGRKESHTGISPMYRRLFELYMMMDFERYQEMTLRPKHMKLINSFMKFFGIRSKSLMNLLKEDLKEVRQGGSHSILKMNLENKLNPDSDLGRTVMKDYVWECYRNEGMIDFIEQDILENFGRVVFGYKPEDIVEITEEMKEENNIIRQRAASNTALKYVERKFRVNRAELEAMKEECMEKRDYQELKCMNENLQKLSKKESLENKVDTRLAEFISCVRFALADNIINTEEDAILREIGLYFGVRDEGVYNHIVGYVASEMEEERKKGLFNVLIINGDSSYTDQIRNRIRPVLKNSVYNIAFSPMDEGLNAFGSINPKVVFVDSSYHIGREMIEFLTNYHPDVAVYSLKSRGSVRHGSEKEEAAMLGVKGIFILHNMFPGILEAIKNEYMDRSI